MTFEEAKQNGRIKKLIKIDGYVNESIHRTMVSQANWNDKNTAGKLCHIGSNLFYVPIILAFLTALIMMFFGSYASIEPFRTILNIDYVIIAISLFLSIFLILLGDSHGVDFK
jgi:hypothetical protein